MKPIGQYSMGYNGIHILQIEYDIEDYVIWKFPDEEKIHKSKIYYLNNDKAYFRANKLGRIYFDEIMRT